MERDTSQTASIPKRGQLPTSNSVDTAAANLRCAAALLSALYQGGVRHVVISSGSRCAPLVLAAGHCGGLKLWTNPDERSAAFCALGIAKATYQPAALICTSGTATANYLPAIIEAKMSGAPMVVITADRPSRLRESGAPQTINQIDLYGHYAIMTRDLPLPFGSETAITWRDAGLGALSMISPRDPVVHLNAPFDEPLIPAPEAAAQIVADECSIAEVTETSLPIRELPASDKWDLQQYARQLADAKRPIIICGAVNAPLNSMKRILDLARRYRAPVIADCASQLRRHPGVVCHGDLILRDPLVGERLAPDLILRIGWLPTSRALNDWIASTPAKEKIAISARRPADPDRCLTHHLWTHLPTAIDVLTAGDGIEENSQWEYRDLWISCDRAAGEVIQRMSLSSGDAFEPAIVADACRMMRGGMNLFLSNSMPIRWAEMYSEAHAEFPRVFVNRGANGIDGIVSTASGVARSSSQTTVCILGDLTFLHDPNGLWRLRAEQVPLKLVVLNNDGGGVFHFLPIASHSEHFESLVAMPHGVEMSHLAAAHGIPHHMCESRTHFNDLFEACLRRPGPEIIEIHTHRASNFKRHQEIVDHVARATRTALGLE